MVAAAWLIYADDDDDEEEDGDMAIVTELSIAIAAAERAGDPRLVGHLISMANSSRRARGRGGMLTSFSSMEREEAGLWRLWRAWPGS